MGGVATGVRSVLDRGLVSEGSRGSQFGGDLGDLELDRLVFGDRSAELDAFFGEGDGQLQGAQVDAERLGRAECPSRPPVSFCSACR